MSDVHSPDTFEPDTEYNTGRELDTGLDWASPTFSADEKERLVAWYNRTHRAGDANVEKFMRFMFDFDPVGFKLYRRNAVSMLARPRDGVTLPQLAVTLMFLHLYTTWGKVDESLYEVVAARSHGATKRQVIATLRFAFLNAGPCGLNGPATLVPDYLDAWLDDGRPSPVQWPPGWSSDRARLESGLDVTVDDLSRAELSSLADWHARTGGDAEHVRLWGELHGEALKTWRLRYEAALGEDLPVQMAPLFILHLATWNCWPSVVRRAILQARALGVRRHHVIQTISWAAFIYGGEWKLEAALADSMDVIRRWDDIQC